MIKIVGMLHHLDFPRLTRLVRLTFKKFKPRVIGVEGMADYYASEVVRAWRKTYGYGIPDLERKQWSVALVKLAKQDGVPIYQIDLEHEDFLTLCRILRVSNEDIWPSDPKVRESLARELEGLDLLSDEASIKGRQAIARITPRADLVNKYREALMAWCLRRLEEHHRRVMGIVGMAHKIAVEEMLSKPAEVESLMIKLGELVSGINLPKLIKVD